jgi:hypothetical protein
MICPRCGLAVKDPRGCDHCNTNFATVANDSTAREVKK